jgi:16S rRNA (cytosine967-C5)-methyltransferase
MRTSAGGGATKAARAIAFETLRRVERGGAFAALLLQQIDRSVSERETALATELVYGCLRHRLHDERLISVLADRPLCEIDPDLALLFRVAAHQILRLDRIPERAAVHEAVALARTLGRQGRDAAKLREGGARFLNALLRRLCREKSALPLPDVPSAEVADRDPEAAAAALSVHFSHPEWIVRRWLARLGYSGALALLESNNRPADLTVRVDVERGSVDEAAAALASEGVRTSPSSRLPEFLRVLEGVPQRTACFRKGWIYIQDEASGIIPHLLRVSEGSRILDGCAAPGGKTSALARRVGRKGLVIAEDLHPSRLRLVAANARRMRLGNVRCVAGDLSRPPFHRLFDSVLVDAPCSGSGVFGKDVESRYRLSPEDLVHLAANQLLLLEGAASIVRPGGRLLYSVCSIEPEEGPQVVAALLEKHAEFEREDLRPLLPSHPDLFAEDGTLRTLPHRDKLDGFFAAGIILSKGISRG